MNVTDEWSKGLEVGGEANQPNPMKTGKNYQPRCEPAKEQGKLGRLSETPPLP